jgi:hypothetical protein
MHTNVRVDELVVAKHRLVQVVEDPEIRKNHSILAEHCFNAVLGLEKQIMSLQTTKGHKKLLNANKHKQTRNRV